MPVTTSLKNSKPRKVKFSIGKSKSSENDFENVDSKRKGVQRFRKGQTSRNGRAEVNFGEDSKIGTGKRGVKLRVSDRKKEVRNEGSKGIEFRNVNRKRMRVYADEGLEIEETSNRKSPHRVAKNDANYSSGKGKQMVKDKSIYSEKLGEGSTLAGRKKSKESEIVEKQSFRGKLKVTNKVDVRVDGTVKKLEKGKSETMKRSKQNQNTSSGDSLKLSTKKKVQNKKIAGLDAREAEEQPKKKKRIRIDPYDASNKRMDDGFVTKDGEEKKKDLPKTSNGELSKNAQFRAILPSPSILSFVEDNLLGRRREIEIKRAGYNIDLSAPLDNIPFSTSSERERIEEPAFRNKMEFFAAAKISSSFPPPDLPEIAFAGRSNVGKSSMLNALTRQWGVVRTSDKPGLTQTINFFKLGSKLCLVDLPGYGFAYAKEEVKEAWEELVKEYVSTRVGLKRVCLLVDTKWGMKPRDYELVDLMERSKTKYQILLTKTDLVFPIDVARRAMQIEESLKEKKSAVQPVMMVSSKSGAGIRSLRTALSKIARFVKP